MALTLRHAKTDNIADWTQTKVDQAIADGSLPPGTTPNDIVLSSDWNADHTVSGTLGVANGGTGVATLTGIVKGNGTSAFSAAVAGTDYQAPIGTISGIAKGNGANALTAAVAGTDYQAPLTAGTDYANLAFKTVAVSGQSDVVADSAADTLTLAAGSNITITTDAATDTVTIAAAAGGGNAFGTIAVSGQSDVVADAAPDTLTLAASTCVTITTNATTDTVTLAVSGTKANFNTACSDGDFGFLDSANSWTAEQTFKELSETVYTITDGAAFEIDPVNGSYQKITLGANRTPKATNFASGQSVILKIADGTAYTITWTDATLNPTWVGGTAPTLATTGYTLVQLWKDADAMYGRFIGNVA